MLNSSMLKNVQVEPPMQVEPNPSFEFDYHKMNTFKFVRCSKNDVRVSSMSNLVNVVKIVLGSKFDVRSFQGKNRVFEFNFQKMNMFEFDYPLMNMF